MLSGAKDACLCDFEYQIVLWLGHYSFSALAPYQTPFKMLLCSRLVMSFLAKTHLDQSVGQSLRQRFYSFKPEWEWRPLEFPVQFPMLSQCAILWLNHKRTTKIDRLHFPVVSLTSVGFSLAHQDVSFSFFCSYSVCCYWLPGFQPSPLKV